MSALLDGPKFDPEGAYALVTGKFLKQKKERKPLTITGDGTQTRDFTHVFDVVRGNLLAASSAKRGRETRVRESFPARGWIHEPSMMELAAAVRCCWINFLFTMAA